jgi:hypothetical protein
MSIEQLNMRSRQEVEVHINLLEERKKELTEELKSSESLYSELIRLEAKMDALHWVLHNSKSRLHESFYGKETK